MSSVLRFKIELLEVAPPIWRRIEVPGDYSFWDLHVAIQDAMGWTDSHLHAFRVPTRQGGLQEIGIPDPDGEFDVVPGWRRKVRRHFKEPGDQIAYEYDFGDGWRHTVLLEGILLAEPGVTYPRCLDGARRCPPEDCGGTDGFEEFLRAVSNRRHPEHREMLIWCGGTFDPQGFDPAGRSGEVVNGGAEERELRDDDIIGQLSVTYGS